MLAPRVASAWLLLGSILVAGCGGDDTMPPLIAPDSGPPAPPVPPPLDATPESGSPDAGGEDDAAAPPPPPMDMGTDASAPIDSGPGPTDTGPTDAGTADAGPIDRDRDGLDDAFEDRAAAEYLPFLSMDPTDGCPRATAIFRARPHPDDATLLYVEYVLLFERDCGALGHVGDNEGFGVTVDPSVPGAEGILAVRAISHRGTACHSATTCGRSTCGGVDGCAFGTRRGVRYPVVFFSAGKHGGYMSEDACDGACILTNYCVLADLPFEPALLNVGEPDAPLVSDLTAAGAITSAGGWREMDLFGYDPWGGDDFGGAGNVAAQLMDPELVPPTCR
ncbi:MAG: hypothetical protein IT379_04815 [Deltaproteobacteria bacterium]|nr:hypothetical protein [Deltaproteobacteria bacterium]